MDDSESKREDAEINKLLDLYLDFDEFSYALLMKQNKSVTKYTRIPDLDINSEVKWPHKSLEPRLRRIVIIEEPKPVSCRSLKSQVAIPQKAIETDVCKRKLIAIEEDYNNFQPQFSQNIKKSYKMVNRAIETDENKKKKKILKKNMPKIYYSSKNPKETKNIIKQNIKGHKKKTACNKTENNYKTSVKLNNSTSFDTNNIRSNETVQYGKNVNLSKIKEVENSNLAIKNKLRDSTCRTVLKRTVSEKVNPNRSSTSNLNKVSSYGSAKRTNKSSSIIHVPLEDRTGKQNAAMATPPNKLNYNENKIMSVESRVQVVCKSNVKHVTVETDILTNKLDQETEIDEEFYTNKNIITKQSFDSLDVPNVSLTNRQNDISKEKLVDLVNNDNLTIKSSHSTNKPTVNEEIHVESHLNNNTSYVISRATVTCTTEQQINFHVVGNNETFQSRVSSKQYSYPFNVVSVFKQEMKNQEQIRTCHTHYDKDGEETHANVTHSKDLTSVNCSYVFDNEKFIKPSQLISTIDVDNLSHRGYICEQFQRELNFIDSFFESLQYLESCSLSEKSITEQKIESFINSSGQNLSNIELGSYLKKFEEDVIDDTDTMPSKNLCQLNLLIRDEQRRAKGILFVLKMREDALKDFTKSHILYLENKKKQDNIDISTLKKKQRGALLKLQQECGEMHRMRKALLTVLEKRKLALMKTKKNEELKLRNSLDVKQILLGNKKLRRSLSADRNIAPVKCFELSSSGCDDSTTSRPKSAPTLLADVSKCTNSAEKYVQTGDSVMTQVDQSNSTTDENFVVVDGGYLNILFHNLSLPQIFSSGKQYEVNQEALKNIVQTSNKQHVNKNNDIVVEDLMDQIKDLDRSSTPSTARSLVEEFDQIYRGLAEDEQLKSDPEQNYSFDTKDMKDVLSQMSMLQENDSRKESDESPEEALDSSSDVPHRDLSCTCESLMLSVGIRASKGKDGPGMSVSGPLPVPAGAAAAGDDHTDVQAWVCQTSSLIAQDDNSCASSQSLCSSVSSLTSPAYYEAEELRRQQLEIEREIKALEQQHCHLVLREIPDKPPPPYTPPSEAKPRTPRNFCVDELAQKKIKDVITEPNADHAATDAFDVFVSDFCQDAIEKQKIENNEKYWDTYNFLPSKTPLSTEKFVKKTIGDLGEVLAGVKPTIVSGVGARRSDHIDDILFAEWRRCEPEWTSLHADDVVIKNQVFESIFQKILTETIDEYKTKVLKEKCTTSN